MDWVKQLNIAIRYIEEHLTGTIEYDELAKMLCCSTYQFQRMFAFMNDVPLSEYIRRRKLSLAVADIQNGERVIDVALKYGYPFLIMVKTISPEVFMRWLRRIATQIPIAKPTTPAKMEKPSETCSSAQMP